MSAGSQEKGAIGAMFEREMKQEKNLEVKAVMSGKYTFFTKEPLARPRSFNLALSINT